MYNKRDILKVLVGAGIRIKDGRISKTDLKRALGADLSQLTSPAEWLVSTDLGFDIPDLYQSEIDKDFNTHGRVVNTATYKMARFTDEENLVDGILYQYSFKFNPRNIKYAYKLFLNGQLVSQHAGIRSALEAEAACEKAAQELLHMAGRP